VSTTATQFTIADLERMPDDGMHREILDGELIELPPSKLVHQDITKRIFLALVRYEQNDPGFIVYQEAGFKLSRELNNWLQPDVSVIASQRVRSTPPDGYIEGAPEVAFEIISPSDSASDVLEKTEAYLKAGSKAVVNVYPKSRWVTIHLVNGSSRTLKGNDTLTVLDVLPGWEMSLPEIVG
jgi:Uma2 family endonuclease